MKRILSILLVLCMMSALIPVSVLTADAATHGYLLGDANDDTNVTLKDVLLVRRYVAGVAFEKELNSIAADTDKDGDVTLKDVLVLRKVVAGVLTVEGNNTDKRYSVDTLSIGGRNISRYTIVIPDGNECMEFAADELRNYVNNACGVALNVTKDPSSVAGYAIRYRFDTENEYELGTDGYKVTLAENGDLEVICGSMRGPIYSAYYILRQFGWRFFTAQITYLYPAENANIPEGFDETEVPVFKYRECNMRGISDVTCVRIGLNGISEKNKQMYRYGGRVGTTKFHAHSYHAQCGMNSDLDDNPCLTSEDTYQQIITYNYNLVKEREEAGMYIGIHYTQISCAPNDSLVFCQCTGCKAVYEEDGSISGAVIRLANRVADKMSEDYPELEIYTIAYSIHRIAPKVTRPRENVTLMFCMGGCNNHTYDDTEACANCGGNERLWITDPYGNRHYCGNDADMEWFEQWRELTDNIQIWYYGANFAVNLAPSPNIFNVYNDFKEMASRGITGVYCEGGMHPYASFEYLRAFLASQMMWDPFMSEEEFNEHINDYLIAYYGPGWGYIREYLNMAMEAGDVDHCWTNNYDRPWNIYSKDYFLENYKYMVSLFDKAKDMAENQWQAERIDWCRLQCEFLGLSATYERDWVNGDDASKAEYAEHYKFLYDTIVYYSNPSNGIPIRITTYSGKAPGYCDNFPTSSEDIRDTMTWIAPGFDGLWHYLPGEDRWV